MTTVAEIGERKVIETIMRNLTFRHMPIPFGDDVSGVESGRGRVAILKVDMLVGRTDVPVGMSLWQAARKAVVMNVSDFAAKGVRPRALLVSLGLPSTFLKKDVKCLAKGLDAGAREYDTYVVGGDTSEASDLIIGCSLFGFAEKNLLMLRSGARPGDIVAVSGFFGKTAAGLMMLLEQQSYASAKERRIFLDAVLMPKARLREGLVLAMSKAVSASIDSSDGLAWSLFEIGKASNVGFMIDTLPIAPEVSQFAKRNRVDALELALYGGEEYELVITIKPRLWRKAVMAVKQAGGALMEIGRVTKETDILLRSKGKTIPIAPRGWEHFRTNK